MTSQDETLSSMSLPPGSRTTSSHSPKPHTLWICPSLTPPTPFTHTHTHTQTQLLWHILPFHPPTPLFRFGCFSSVGGALVLGSVCVRRGGGDGFHSFLLLPSSFPLLCSAQTDAPACVNDSSGPRTSAGCRAEAATACR